MSDNVTVRPSQDSTAVNVATDDVNDVHYPIYKMAIGEDGNVTLLSLENRLPIAQDENLLNSVNEMVKQMKIMNLHLSVVTDLCISKEDV